MSRPTTTLVVFFIAFNAFALMLMATGVSGAMGLDANVGGDEAVEDVQQQSDEIDSGSSTGNTLFGMYNVLSQQVGNILGVIFPGLGMLQRAGVPSYITTFLASLFGVVLAIDVISFLRGWNL